MTSNVLQFQGPLSEDVTQCTTGSAGDLPPHRVELLHPGAHVLIPVVDVDHGVELEADVVLPAKAQKEAAQLNAQGEAAVIEENGRAMAEVLQMLTDAWQKAGADAKDIFLIQQLEDIMQTVVKKVNHLHIQHVTLLDDGTGQALPRHVASFPAMVRQVLDELHQSTGVDVTGILSQKSQEVK